MIINQSGADFIYDGASYKIGDRIIGTPESEYEGLYGLIFEIRDGEDKETDNETPDIYCSFEEPILPHEISKLEKTFSDLYGEPKNLDDIVLDHVIMAPEMIRVILPTSEPLKQMIYSVYEEWAFHGSCDSLISRAYTSMESAMLYMRKVLREEMEDGIVADMRADKNFVEESYDDSYECFIDGDYYENHYRIYITAQPVVVTPQFVREMAEIYHLAMFTEDFISMLEDDDEITPEEREWLIAEPGIIDQISTTFENYDTFWECYWDVFRDIAEEKLMKYREENQKQNQEESNETYNV